MQSYSYGQYLQGQYYTNCVRTEDGYCGILWKASSTTSPDSFGITSTDYGACPSGYVAIPGLSMDGTNGIGVPLGTQAFQSIVCGTEFGVVTGATGSTAASLICEYHFTDSYSLILFSYSQGTALHYRSLLRPNFPDHQPNPHRLQPRLHSGTWTDPTVLISSLLCLGPVLDLSQTLSRRTGPVKHYPQQNYAL